MGPKNVCGFRYLRSSWAKKENNIKTPEVHVGSGITRLWHTYCRAPNPKNQSVLCARAVVSRIVVAFGNFTLFGPSNPHVTFRVKAQRARARARLSFGRGLLRSPRTTWTVSKKRFRFPGCGNGIFVARGFVHIQKTLFLCVFARKQIPLRNSKCVCFVCFVWLCREKVLPSR